MKSTQATTFRSLKSELGSINNRLEDLRNQAATGKKLIRPSDNPAAIRPVLSARTQIRSTDRFIESLSTSLDRLENQDTYLDQAENLLVSAKETAINAINGAMSDADLDTLADQISYIKTEMMSVANAQVGGQYIFAGFEEDTVPFVADGDVVSYQGDSNIKRLETSPGELVQTNLDGAKLFMGMSDTDGDGVLEKTGENVFDVLTNLERAIRGESGHVYNGSAALPSNDIGYLDGTNGNYTPVVLDVAGDPLVDINSGGPVALLTSAGDPINLQPVLNTEGDTLTIAEYNAHIGPDFVKDYLGVAISGDDLDNPMYLHADGSTPEYSAAGEPVLTYDAGASAFLLLNSDSSPIQLTVVPTMDEMLSTLETAADESRSARGLMGNNAQRIETSREHLEGVKIDLAQILSRYEDVDLISVFTEITQTESALEAALNVTGKVSQLSIMDFM